MDTKEHAVDPDKIQSTRAIWQLGGREGERERLRPQRQPVSIAKVDCTGQFYMHLIHQ